MSAGLGLSDWYGMQACHAGRGLVLRAGGDDAILSVIRAFGGCLGAKRR